MTTKTNLPVFKQKLAEPNIRNKLELRFTLLIHEEKNKVAAATVVNSRIFC